MRKNTLFGSGAFSDDKESLKNQEPCTVDELGPFTEYGEGVGEGSLVTAPEPEDEDEDEDEE